MEKYKKEKMNKIMNLHMKKNLSYAALAIMALVSCTSNDYVGDQKALENTETNRSISFGMRTPGITRADKAGSDAATDLSNQFIVWGEKNETSGAAAAAGNLVFKNYLVDWYDFSAYTTTSNTKSWEYVGLKLDDPTASPATTTYSTNILPNSGTVAQTIKYWDYGASTYTFTAVSALPADITAGNVKITKTQSGETVSDKGYSVTLTADANLDKLFFAERINIAKSNNTDRNQANKYGGNVTFRFHNMATKVRVAMYETVPGYSVTIKEFKVTDAADPAFSAMTTSKTAKFAANLQNCVTGTAGTMTVKYVATDGPTLNHPTVSFAPTSAAANVLELGTGLKENITIGESATAATFDKAEKAYTSVFPNETNAQNLKLKLSYTLTAPVTGEKIEITDKTAEIPAQYLQWKPGYAYTYIFKITDDNLYPITFDAVEVISEDGESEYITTVTEPSITTFGVKGGKYVAGKNEYEAGSDIYATFMEGSEVKTPVLGTSGAQHVNVFKVTSADPTNFPITEASVAEAIAHPASITNPVYTCAVTDVAEKVAADLTNDGTYYKKDANNKAPGETGYVPTIAVKNTDYIIGATTADNTIADGVNIYTCTVTYTSVASAADLTTGTTYYKADSNSKDPGTDGYVPTIAVAGTDYQVAPKVAATNINDDATTNFTAAPAAVTSVPSEDGRTKTIAALKLTGVKAGTYAIEYEPTAPAAKVYKVIRVVEP